MQAQRHKRKPKRSSQWQCKTKAPFYSIPGTVDRWMRKEVEKREKENGKKDGSPISSYFISELGLNHAGDWATHVEKNKLEKRSKCHFWSLSIRKNMPNVNTCIMNFRIPKKTCTHTQYFKQILVIKHRNCKKKKTTNQPTTNDYHQHKNHRHFVCKNVLELRNWTDIL